MNEAQNKLSLINSRAAVRCAQTLLYVLVLAVGRRVRILSVAGSGALGGVRAGHWTALLRQKPSTRTRLACHETPETKSRTGSDHSRDENTAKSTDKMLI